MMYNLKDHLHWRNLPRKTQTKSPATLTIVEQAMPSLANVIKMGLFLYAVAEPKEA